MPKRKTSIAVDEKLWEERIKFVKDKTRSARKHTKDPQIEMGHKIPSPHFTPFATELFPSPQVLAFEIIHRLGYL